MTDYQRSLFLSLSMVLPSLLKPGNRQDVQAIAKLLQSNECNCDKLFAQLRAHKCWERGKHLKTAIAELPQATGIAHQRDLAAKIASLAANETTRELAHKIVANRQECLTLVAALSKMPIKSKTTLERVRSIDAF